MSLMIPPNITLPETELDFSFVRSSGPGGQNVNKVNSKAVLRWNLLASPSLPLAVRARLIARLRNQMTTAGDLIISSDRYRDQGRNRQDCLDKLRLLISESVIPPKLRKATRPSYSSQRKNQDAKTQHKQKKALRKKTYE